MGEQTKICFKCDTEAPLSNFYRHPNMSDGHSGKCKECTRKDARQNRAAKAEYYRAFDRARTDDPKRVAARRDYREKNKDDPGFRQRMRESQQWYLDRNTVKRRAHIMSSNAIRDKILVRGPCEICGAEKTDAHHEDYYKPLDVRWLCKRCHGLRHREINAAIRAGENWSAKGF